MVVYSCIWLDRNEVKRVGLERLPTVITVKELADYLKVSDQTIKKALKFDKLKGFKIGRDWRISKEAVLQWIEAK